MRVALPPFHPAVVPLVRSINSADGSAESRPLHGGIQLLNLAWRTAERFAPADKMKLAIYAAFCLVLTAAAPTELLNGKWTMHSLQRSNSIRRLMG